MPLSTLISWVPMIPLAIERLLNSLTDGQRIHDHDQLANESRQRYAQLEQNLREQQQRNYALAAQNQQLSEQLAIQERSEINDVLTSQIQHFVKPINLNEKEANDKNDFPTFQDQCAFVPITINQKQRKQIDNVPTHQPHGSNSHPVASNQRFSEKIQTNDDLAVENRELQQQLDNYQKEHEEQLKAMNKLMVEMKEKKLNSFEAIENNDKTAKEALIHLAKQAKPIRMEGKNVALFGLTSTGKSTLLNNLIGEKRAATGIGETTVTIKSYPSKYFILWDIPGRNDEISYLSLEYISLFKGLTRRLILIQSTIKENSSMMQFLDAIDLNYDIVVNKMDRVEEEERAEFCEQIRQEIQKIGLKSVGHLFFVSAKYPAQFSDWLEMVNYLTNSPQ
ncbi:unnamed protein product [Rotaria sp. Silwood2]|nr:unnamed protein product [Rotaria sp. Silwood2]